VNHAIRSPLRGPRALANSRVHTCRDAGSRAGDWGKFRHFHCARSSGDPSATIRRIGPARDPLGGFFGVRRGEEPVSPATFLDWRRRSQAFEDIAAYAGPATLDLSGSGPPEEVFGQSVTTNLLPLLGVPAFLGRTFLQEEEHENSNVVVLSYRLWQRRFGGDPGLIGHAVVMNGHNYTVTGVMPCGFNFPTRKPSFEFPWRCRHRF